jgi:hypothetical protein
MAFDLVGRPSANSPFSALTHTQIDTADVIARTTRTRRDANVWMAISVCVTGTVLPSLRCISRGECRCYSRDTHGLGVAWPAGRGN